ncbi:DUF4148 domain-containing protein [Caballeronia telluris]|uniref:Membrane protein n=1 Tax=Caballeronia telluris TaxID=326475 RepID=A0A158KC46_9BURK|nr:DUF4148 domain-containing protein [Caballeronia telluris]SAL78605.1 membrane protein [Caballeronia telluris]
MKTLIKAVLAAAVFAVSVVSFAQSDSPVTRAEVRADLNQLQLAGYKPASGDEPNYPANIQAAEARVAAGGAATGYGGATSGSSASGGGAAVRPASTSDLNRIYFGGQ